MDAPQVRRRVKAARALAGLSVPQLAARINQKGLGERTLRELEGEKGREYRSWELREIARACDLPYAFFTIDLQRLAELDDPDAEIGMRTAEATQRLIDTFAETHTPGEVLEKIAKAIENVEARLADLEAERRGEVIDETRDLISATRRTKQTLREGLPAEHDEETPAAADTRDEADATPEAPVAPARGTRGT